MSSGSFAVLAKNTMNSIGGFNKFFAACPGALATWKKIKDRQWEAAPQPVKDQAEVYEETAFKRHLCQHKNLWVDPELGTICSQKELAEYCHFKQDMWRMAHWGGLLPIIGGYALPLYVFWFGNNTWVPSTFNSTPEQVLEWRKSQDLYRYKHAPALLAFERWFAQYHMNISQESGLAFDMLYDKNDVRKDPKLMRKIADGNERVFPFFRCRRKQIRCIAHAMGIPSFPMFAQINLQARIKDYWEIIWNEDLIVIKGNLHQAMSDEELQDYAWRRFMSPYDKELSRDEILRRVEDYHAYLGSSFVSEGRTPNIFITINYVMGYYNDPAYLEGDIAELDSNDFDHLQSWGKDAFLKRLEFENGPLRDQVEAHSIKSLAEREKRLAE